MNLKKCIVISDSFKGTLSSMEICKIARECFQSVLPACHLIPVPVADGGEGTVVCFHEACGGQEVPVYVRGPYGEPLETSYLQLEDGQAVIEMAAAAGLPLVGKRKDPSRTSTYGVGQMIRHAVEHGNRKILIGLGGSCTNDGGCGCAAALGVRFLDWNGGAFVPVGGTLDQIARIDRTETVALLKGVEITAMCDIDNPMHGPMGAAYIFGPQKGADTGMTAELDRQLKALDEVIQRQLGRQVAEIPGSGAAGAFGAGILAFLDGQLCPGIEAMLDLVKFDSMLVDCGLVITGEGCFDSQSLRGKVVSGVCKRAKEQGVPVVVIAGSIAEEIEEAGDDPEFGVKAVFSINRQALDFEEAKYHSRKNYQYTLKNVLRLLSCG